MEEKGLQTLFMALGMATWEVTDGGHPPEAAVLLVPITIGSLLRGYQSFTLQRSGDIQVNPVLLHVLETEHGCEIDLEELLPETSEEDESFDPTPIYDQLKKATDTVKGFTIKQSTHISHFYYQKMSLVEELSNYATQIAAHDLIAAIAGDKKTRESIRQGVTEINPREFDKIPPQNEFLTLPSRAYLSPKGSGGNHSDPSFPPLLGKGVQALL